MKNVIIIHGCPSKKEDKVFNKHWLPWVKTELTARGIKTETPPMPNPWAPDYETFKKEFEKYPVSEDTILVGHSCGCAFLARWLGESKKKIAKLILVAPWKVVDKDDAFRPAFYNYRIDGTIQSRVGEIVMFTSGNEEADGKKSLKMFHDALGGEVISLPDHGHYTFGDMGTEEFPELLDEIIDEEDDEEEEEEEKEQKDSKKSAKSGSPLKTIATFLAGSALGAAVGAGAAFTICQNANTIQEPVAIPATDTNAAVPVPSSATLPPRSTSVLPGSSAASPADLGTPPTNSDTSGGVR